MFVFVGVFVCLLACLFGKGRDRLVGELFWFGLFGWLVVLVGVVAWLVGWLLGWLYIWLMCVLLLFFLFG